MLSRIRAELPDVPVLFLTAMLANLLSNARTHAPPGTAVEVAVAAADAHATLTVTDNGPGITRWSGH